MLEEEARSWCIDSVHNREMFKGPDPYPLIDFSHKEYLKRGKVIPELKCLPLNTEVKGTWISTLKFEISAITGTRNGLLKV